MKQKGKNLILRRPTILRKINAVSDYRQSLQRRFPKNPTCFLTKKKSQKTRVSSAISASKSTMTSIGFNAFFNVDILLVKNA
ncbi:unnamed protein product [Oikopleura dioica]|uniref:Uncharacterized protein n=1 Tax=Oikopleura dioica TaxID=34765 RepID=E4YMK4_OIKDI|nr:unnamed protein product [Oikopleura dioica]